MRDVPGLFVASEVTLTTMSAIGPKLTIEAGKFTEEQEVAIREEGLDVKSYYGENSGSRNGSGSDQMKGF